MTTIHAFNRKYPTVLVAVILLLAGAGAAAGATMAGNIDGEMTTEVDQAIVMNTTEPGQVQADKNGFVNVNDDGTAFRTTAEINQGDDYEILLNLTYNGQTETNGELVLDVPAGLAVDVVPGNDTDEWDTSSLEDHGNVSVGQVDSDTWVLDIEEQDGDSEDGFRFHLGIQIESDNSIEPGFYTIEGEVYPVDV